MAAIEKRSGRSGVRWRVRIRNANCSMLSRTFNYKADAEAWAKETERSLKVGIYNKTPIPKALRNLLTRYINEVSITKRGYKEERLRLLR